MIRPATNEAYKLMHDGAIALAEVESVGMRVSTDRLDKNIRRVGKKIAEIEDQLRQDEVWRLQRRRFGSKANLGSRQQLGAVLFEDMGFKSNAKTAKGQQAVDKDALSRIDLPYVELFVRAELLKKLQSTYLEGVRREVVDGVLRAFYNLNTTVTYRGSSDTPNFQNFPIRDPEIGKYIRSCFIPRDDHVIIETDYSAIEVRVAACYHLDPTMLKYIEDGYDMHRDMGAQCYKLPTTAVPKPVRNTAKAFFVFAQFYGDYYASCAQKLWRQIELQDLKTEEQVPLYEHLASCGITKLGKCDPDKSPAPGTFEKHILDVENDFWGNRFPVYDQWKRDWYAAYKKKGYFHTKTGFLVQGVFKRNNAVNYPVQGSAFHCLLWSLIRITRELRKRKMRSRVVGQIHDSIVGDVHYDEREEYLAIVNRIMTQDIRRAWPWIVCPLEMEAEGCELGESWHDKKKLKVA